MEDTTDMALDTFKEKLRKVLLGTAIVAVIFFCWAVYNVVVKGLPDLGVITFTLVAVSALFGVHVTYAETSLAVERLPVRINCCGWTPFISGIDSLY